MATSQASRNAPLNRSLVNSNVKPYASRPITGTKVNPSQKILQGFQDLDEIEDESQIVSLPTPRPVPQPTIAFVPNTKPPAVRSYPNMSAAAPIDSLLITYRQLLAANGWQDVDTVERKKSTSAANPGREYWFHTATKTWLGWVQTNAEREANPDPIPFPWEPLNLDLLPHLVPFGWNEDEVSQMFQRGGVKDQPASVLGLYWKMTTLNNIETMGYFDTETGTLTVKYRPERATDAEIQRLIKVGWPLDGLTLYKIRSGPKAKQPGKECFWVRDAYGSAKRAVYACYCDQVYPPKPATLEQVNALRN